MPEKLKISKPFASYDGTMFLHCVPRKQMLSWHLESNCPTEKVQWKFYGECPFFVERCLGQFSGKKSLRKFTGDLLRKFSGGVKFSREITGDFFWGVGWELDGSYFFTGQMSR